MKYIIIDTKINANKLEIYLLEGHTALMGYQVQRSSVYMLSVTCSETELIVLTEIMEDHMICLDLLIFYLLPLPHWHLQALEL